MQTQDTLGYRAYNEYKPVHLHTPLLLQDEERQQGIGLCKLRSQNTDLHQL